MRNIIETMREWSLPILMAILAICVKVIEIAIWTFFLGSSLALVIIVLWS